VAELCLFRRLELGGGLTLQLWERTAGRHMLSTFNGGLFACDEHVSPRFVSDLLATRVKVLVPAHDSQHLWKSLCTARTGHSSFQNSAASQDGVAAVPNSTVVTNDPDPNLQTRSLPLRPCDDE